jgi:membrane protease YdiL (CAAX protease family)
MTTEHIQGTSRSLIFLGLLIVSAVAASGISTVLSGFIFGDVAAVVPGGAMPSGANAWWQLHFQNLCSQAIGFGGAVWLAMRIWGRTTLAGFPGSKQGLRFPALILAILATVASGPLLMASYELNVAFIPEGGLMEQVFKPLEEMLEALTAFLASGEGIQRVVILLSVAVLPAIFEELSFRGVLQPLLIKATGSAFWGIAITAVVFSAIHFQFYGFLPRVLLGALFGWLAHRSGSLVPGMAAHFVNNAMAAITLWFTGSMTEDIVELTPTVLTIGAVLTGLACLGFDRLIRQRRSA